MPCRKKGQHRVHFILPCLVARTGSCGLQEPAELIRSASIPPCLQMPVFSAVPLGFHPGISLLCSTPAVLHLHTKPGRARQHVGLTPFLPPAPKVTPSRWQHTESLSSHRGKQPLRCLLHVAPFCCRSPRICVSAAPTATLGPQFQPPWWLASLLWL